MGLLSDPSLTPRNKLARNLAKHSGKICFLFYFAGLIWLACFGNDELNHGTYLSENALSPGLVYPEVKQDSSRLAQTLLEELQREHETHKSSTPHAWITAKMMQMGLETHVHNFTLKLGAKEYHGKNIYGILRAPRIGSTEGVVFSAPYRPPSSVHTDITASVPVLLAFAEFARRKNYWAKDLIFLVTEQEQLGMHAWLEAYYNGGIDDSEILKCGNLPARAGALQAALNLEIQDLNIDYIDVKIEGLNGQLPNLDMFNLVQRITSREGIVSGYKQMPRKKRRYPHSNIEENLKHMMKMLLSQATGVPNGNHGLFHRYRIESLTLEAVKRTSASNSHRNSVALPLLKTIEGISRSLNNLLERFHQSYFFYILVQNDRFISIGDFMPCLILMTSPMFIKAFLLWLSADNKNDNDDNALEESKGTTAAAAASQQIDVQLCYSGVLIYLSTAVALGLLSSFIPSNANVREYMHLLGINTATGVTLILAGFVLLSCALPFVVRLSAGSLELLHIATLMFLGVSLTIIGLLNFALGFLLAAVCVPFGILVKTNCAGGIRKSLTLIYGFLLNPIVVIYCIVLLLTLFQFPELALKDTLLRALNATMDAITFALMDCIIYGNWLYSVITIVLFPLWILFWTLVQSRSRENDKLKLA